MLWDPADQFASSDLRRFNLIAVDMRSHGNTIATTPSTYRAAQAAEDVFCFMVRYLFSRHTDV